MKDFIVQIEPWIDDQELYQLKRVIDSTFVSEHLLNEEFENLIKDRTNSKYAISMVNGTAALFCALKALDIKQGDEVIVPDMTFIASSNAVILAGGTPVLCDIDEESLCIAPEKIKGLITSRTKAIMPVHLYGRACDMDSIIKIAEEHKLKIIEDAAQGVGVLYKGKHVGTLSEVGILSFYANKTITCGEGGIVLTNDDSIKNDCYKMKNHGRPDKGIFVHESIGYNFSLTEMQAAIGISQLHKLNKIISKKQKIYDFYKENLSHCGLIEIPISNETTPVHWFSSFFCEEKEEFKKYLLENKIQTRDFFYPLHMQPCYNDSDVVKKESNFMSSKKVFERGISLPSSYNLEESQLQYICDTINKFYKI